MIDWLSIILPVNTVIPGGHVLKVCPDGEVESETINPLMVKGSFDNSCIVTNVHVDRCLRGQPVKPYELFQTYVYLSGNPSKFLQGHNIHGTNDIMPLVVKWVMKLAKSIGLGVDVALEWGTVAGQGEYEITRIDITESYRVPGDNKNVSKWIYAAHRTARMSHKAASLSGGDTLYFGKSSRRHSVKIYNKLKEMIKHPIDKKLKDPSKDYEKRILDDAENLLRVEVTYRARKLREMGLEMGKHFDAKVIRMLHSESVKGIHISEQIPNYKVNKEIVGRAAYCSYLAWLGGEDLKMELKKSSFYEHRNKLLPFGVDIAIPRDLDNTHQDNVIPLIQVLEAVPVETPEWYYAEGLIAA